MPMMFFCVFTCIFARIYMYICERPDNTRVGANCNSPFHMGEFKNMGEFEMWAICNIGDLRKKHTQQHRANCNVGDLQCGRFEKKTHATA